MDFNITDEYREKAKERLRKCDHVLSELNRLGEEIFIEDNLNRIRLTNNIISEHLKEDGTQRYELYRTSDYAYIVLVDNYNSVHDNEFYYVARVDRNFNIVFELSIHRDLEGICILSVIKPCITILKDVIVVTDLNKDKQGTYTRVYDNNGNMLWEVNADNDVNRQKDTYSFYSAVFNSIDLIMLNSDVIERYNLDGTVRDEERLADKDTDYGDWSDYDDDEFVLNTNGTW